MKKKLFVLLALSGVLLSSCSSGAASLEKCKELYKDKSYSNYASKDFSYDPVEEGKMSDFSDYYSIIEGVRLNTLHNLIDVVSFSAGNANFNHICDNEATWARENYQEEFTYEIKGEEVTTTLVTSKTATKIDKEEVGNSVGYAFSYITNFNSVGLVTKTVLEFYMVRENSKNELINSYRLVSTITSDWTVIN